MVRRMYLKLTVKALRSRRPTVHFLKYIKMIYLQKTKDGFLRVIMQSQKTGTWSTSSLIPRREDIIPRWSQLLTPLFIKGMKNHDEEEMIGCLSNLG